MRLLNHLPIKRKLTLIIMLTSSVALLLACIAFVAYEQVVFRETLVTDMVRRADGVGDNSSAALSFNDPDAAKQALKSLASHPHITRSVVYDKQGKPFARYQRAGGRCPPPRRWSLKAGISATTAWSCSNRSTWRARPWGRFMLRPAWRRCASACGVTAPSSGW